MGWRDVFKRGDAGDSARRREAATRRKEIGTDKKDLKNKRMEQKIKREEARNKVYTQRQGHGVVFFNRERKKKKKRTPSRWRAGKN